jgi:peptide chain release factor 1
VDRSLPQILARYRELTRMLEDPEVARDPNKVREIAKERGRLERPAKIYEKWLGVRRQIRETEDLLKDPEMREAAEEELKGLRAEFERMTEDVADELGSDDAESATSVIVEVRSGVGGDEAALFASELFDMYVRFAE